MTESKQNRASPYCIRLTPEMRAYLERQADGMPLATYIKSLLPDPSKRRRQNVSTIQNRGRLARLIALLGRSELGPNVAELASACRSGSLPVTPDTESALQQAVRDIADMRRMLLDALGLAGGST